MRSPSTVVWRVVTPIRAVGRRGSRWRFSSRVSVPSLGRTGRDVTDERGLGRPGRGGGGRAAVRVAAGLSGAAAGCGWDRARRGDEVSERTLRAADESARVLLAEHPVELRWPGPRFRYPEARTPARPPTTTVCCWERERASSGFRGVSLMVTAPGWWCRSVANSFCRPPTLPTVGDALLRGSALGSGLGVGRPGSEGSVPGGCGECCRLGLPQGGRRRR